jgi:hypothetical protein
MHHMNTLPTSKSVRVTVPVTPEVLALFQRLSLAAGKSVGRLMGEWLDETREGLEPMIEIMLNFKKAPKEAVKALQLHAISINDMAAEAVKDAMLLRSDGAPDIGRKRSATVSGASADFIGKRGLTPPSSNTGGKGTKTTSKSTGGKK